MADPSPICQIVTPVGMLGYGFDENATRDELARLTLNNIPTALIMDSGSTDSGPGKLAFGSMTCPRSAYFNDLTKLLALVDKFRVPLIFSSAGGDGTDEHVQIMLDIIGEIAAHAENASYRFSVISLYSSVSKAIVMSRFKQGRLAGCGPCVPQLTEDDIESAAHIVAQVGFEPFLDAMEQTPDFDIIVGGRAYDPAPYVAYTVFQLKRQYPALTQPEIETRLGGILHMGKILECGGLCALPKGGGATATAYEDGSFHVWPMDPLSRCTPVSVAAHALYENTRPDILYGPGGSLHLNDSEYMQLADGRTVWVRGSRFQSSKKDGKPYQLKLEAAHTVGYRTMFMGTIRDAILIRQIDELTFRIKQYVQMQHRHVQEKWELEFHIYGNQYVDSTPPAEVFLVAETLAPTQELATSLASKARIAMIHGSYPGQKATSGNFGFGIGGAMEIEMGPCAQFCIYHLMDLDVGEERLLANGDAPAVAREPLIRSKVSLIGAGVSSVSSNGVDLNGDALEKRLSRMSIKNSGQNEDTHQSPAQPPPTSPRTLADVSQILRSKNAGPFEITVDILFFTREIYDKIKNSGLLSVKIVAEAMNVTPADIIWMGFFEPALAFKVTIPRYRGGKMTAAGGFMEDDVHGSQQHTGVARLLLPSTYFSH